ncbi:MAG TPA: complex I NDUFA9 subunit family protein [Thermomicrobiales bacterium]|nr:complex I NDUFA9 subunit family protein [Thermomicrobiales bacterium]
MEPRPGVSGLAMRVFLAGATGFIGGHTLRALLARGHEVTCLVRPGSPSLPATERLSGVRGEWTQPDSWSGAVAGHNAVVNTAGIIRERRGASFAAVHTRAAIALFDHAAQTGVEKIVQLSALGADAGAESAFHLSKRAADEHLQRSGAPYVVLRPSFVYGEGDRSMSFFARLAAFPITPVPGDGRDLVQPLHVADLARGIVLSVERPEICDATFDVGGSTTLTFDALLDTLARRRRGRNARKLHIPWLLMGAAARSTDLFGGRGPITRDELSMLRRGNHCDNSAFVRAFGFEPRAFDPGGNDRLSGRRD